jgi:hypothetical protein
MADEMFARVGALRRLLIATLAVTGETLAHARHGAQVQTLDAEPGGGAGAGDEDHIDRCLRQGGGHRHGVHAGVVEGLAGRVGRAIGNRFRLRRHALRAIALRHIEAIAEDHLRGVQLGTGENVAAGVRAPRDQHLAGGQQRGGVVLASGNEAACGAPGVRGPVI